MLFRYVSIVIVLALTSRQSEMNNISGGFFNLKLGKICGFSNVTGTNITGGENATLNAWPWMAAIFENGIHICDGVLITKRYVMTDDHCLRNEISNKLKPAKHFVVRLGELDLKSNKDDANPVDYKVRKLIVHKNHKKFDIALMKLRKKVKFSKSMLPICLPKSPDLIKSTYLDKRPFVVGWGLLRDNGTSSTMLQQMQLDVYPIKQCQKIFGANISDDIVCAGKKENKKDVCPGGYGEPLMTTNSNNQMNIIGVASRVRQCERRITHGIYTRVASILKWIKRKAKIM